MSYTNETEEVRAKELQSTVEDHGANPEDLEVYDLRVVVESHSVPAKRVHDTKKVLHHDLHEDHIDDLVSLLDLRRMDHLWDESVQIGEKHLWDDCGLTWK